jgi:hypothetical protein
MAAVRDIGFVAVSLGFFGLCAAYIRACTTIIGREAAVEVGSDEELTTDGR